MTRKVKVVVEEHDDGYVAYPLVVREGVAIVGEGDTPDEALADVTSALRFTLETAREEEIFDDELRPLDAVVAQVEIPIGVKVSG
jgi:predicted RNase H-like HicB family nuclease